MDVAGEIHAIASMRRDSGSLWWRSGSDDVFSRSSREVEVDDEEALRWAALEKLPTCARARRVIIHPLGAEDTQGVVDDVARLTQPERRALLERLLRVAEDDHERFLRRLKDRLERVGIDMPTIEVRFEHLDVKAEVRVGSSSLPTLLNSVTNTLEEAATALRLVRSRKRTMPILNEVSGIIKPRRMTLLLGPPGSGKTTLLLALAGRLDKHLKVSGRVTFNGHGMDEFVPQRTAAYISQHDLHIAQMTVRETLAFAARCQGVGSRFDMLTELLRREKEANIKPDADVDAFMKASAVGDQQANVVTDDILKILGLEMCADTIIGNEMIRGISGGQRKRVTTGEMLVGPAKALFMDEISTGLDSSTTYHVVNSLRQSIHVLGGTAIISLLQPAPETYNLFDDILLLSHGHIIYQGPREDVLEFFESVGFRCPARKGVADFLQEVSSAKDQKQYWARNEEPYRFVPAKDFAVAFMSFRTGRALARELVVPFDKSISHPAALISTKYGVTGMVLLKANITREFLLIKRNSFVYLFRISQMILVAFLTMTVFFRTKMKRDSVTRGNIYLGALFYSVLQNMFVGFSELALTVSKLPVFFKQRDLLFYPAWSYTIPSWILNVPITFVEVGVYVSITYYVIGFDPNISRFIKQYLLMMGVSQMANSAFRFIGGVTKDIVHANAFASFFTLAAMVLSGFLLTRDKMKKYCIWAYWISPLMYAQNALSVNEMLGHSWSKILNITASKEMLGVQVLKSRGIIFPEANWYWIGFGALVGFILLFNGLWTVALTFTHQYGKRQQTISEAELKGKHADMTNDIGDVKHISPENFNPTSKSIRIGVQMLENYSGSVKKGMVLPFIPLSLSFENIRYSVTMPEEMKAQGVADDRLRLLNDVSGSLRPGVLTALMGVSGAGKTTLMDVLAGRKTGGHMEGNINISGYPKNQKTFARISGYCEQNDIHSPQLTICESLHFSAWLRLPMDVDPNTRMMFVEEVMELMELKPLKDSLVGLPGVTGLSTEQRKRLTIAVELVANPSIIFMDEPTSGLDARAAAIVMRAVRNTVDTGRTVVCTIHQPSIDIFEAFDELFLLKQGGEEIYTGPLGQQSSELIKYFEAIPGVCKIEDGYNPATWMMEVTAVSQEKILGVDFGDLYRKSSLYERNKAMMKELSQPLLGSSDLYFPTKYSLPSFAQFVACLWKHNLSYWRNPSYNGIRLIFTVVIALVLGIVYWDLGGKVEKPQDLFNAMGSMYGAALFLGIFNCRSVQPVVSVERTVFYREKAAGMYSAVPYSLGLVVIELPYALVQTTIYGVIVYAMMGLEWTPAKFFWYLYFMYFTLLYYTFYGMLTISATPNYNIATITCTIFYAIWNLFSGFIIPRPELPIWWRWYPWLCPVAWSLYGLIVSQFGDTITPMFDGTPVKVFVEGYFDYKHSWLGWVAFAVMAFNIIFASLFIITMKKLNFQKR